jgi:hypothetical protein
VFLEEMTAAQRNFSERAREFRRIDRGGGGWFFFGHGR